MVVTISIQPIVSQYFTWKNFIRPYYGPIEYGVFLSTSFLYAIFSYRYIRYRLAQLHKKGTTWEIDTELTSLRLAQQLKTTVAHIHQWLAPVKWRSFLKSRRVHAVTDLRKKHPDADDAILAARLGFYSRHDLPNTIDKNSDQ